MLRITFMVTAALLVSVLPAIGQNASVEEPRLQFGGLEIAEFVDASYFGNDVAGVSGSLGLDQVELDVSRTFGERGSFRVYVEWVNDGEGGSTLDVEQGFVTLDLVQGGDVSLSFGKFNAPIGFELLDAPDMYQFSHALVFDYGLPTNYTGAMVSAVLPGSIDLTAYVSNGWDRNVDLSSGKNVGGRLGFPLGNRMTLGLVRHDRRRHALGP